MQRICDHPGAPRTSHWSSSPLPYHRPMHAVEDIAELPTRAGGVDVDKQSALRRRPSCIPPLSFLSHRTCDPAVRMDTSGTQSGTSISPTRASITFPFPAHAASTTMSSPTSSSRSSRSSSSMSEPSRRYSFADQTHSRKLMTEALVFSWNHFLCPSTAIAHDLQFASYHSSRRLASLHRDCALLDPAIVATLLDARRLGYLYVLVECPLDDFQTTLATFFPKTAALIQCDASHIQLACALKPASLTFTYEHLLYSICAKSARLQQSSISLTVFGPEELRHACLTIARALSTVVPKAIRTAGGTPSFAQVHDRLGMVRQHLEGIVRRDAPSLRPTARPRTVCL
ncbi:hypothetical protein SDRG_14040 [Saprolegnia diclina VS20]|uniref:Uncharacterized protein n=1 Tax=Saprolegnia diclina (strain VS20) TaxID=1156394 RepID=T0Q0X0_SAPDV|nr:hypothetical protein SDRG_14040 [Saprolegnia diclina VS20]EQC28216.1 hypothetical protein SDRG_14040 [Saprolegnia diclina VS20]|eukprot:XP_008618365.1 hypothetical protein SDRG_14040 [Saprolegnia diclina VS20]